MNQNLIPTIPRRDHRAVLLFVGQLVSFLFTPCFIISVFLT